MNYPVTFSKCPACGFSKSFAELETKEEIEKGNLPEGSKIPIMVSQSRIFNPKDNRILLFRKQFPVLAGFFDVCTKCGCLYCKEMQKGVGVIDVKVKPKSLGPDIPPMFGKG